MQGNPSRDGVAGLSEHSGPVSVAVAEQSDMVKLKVTLVAAILDAFDESLLGPGVSTKNPTKQTVDSKPNKGRKRQKNRPDMGEKLTRETNHHDLLSIVQHLGMTGV